jgi:hypothetical protein
MPHPRDNERKDMNPTNQNGHTPEPWRVCDAPNNDMITCDVVGGAHMVYCTTAGRPSRVGCIGGPQLSGQQVEANARRIVAAVNACCSAPTEKLELDYQQGYDPWSHVEHLHSRLTSLEGALREFLKVTEPGIGMKGLSELPGRVDFYDRLTDARKMAKTALSEAP